MPCQRVDRLCMPLEAFHDAFACALPERNRAVAAPAGEKAAIRAPGHGVEGNRIALQDA